MPHALTYIYSSSHNTMGGKKREQWKQKWRDRHLMLFPLKCVKYKLPVSFLMNDLPLWCFKKLFNWHVRISTKFFLVCNLFSIPSVQGVLFYPQICGSTPTPGKEMTTYLQQFGIPPP
jgi:hypothetical protein